MMQKYSLPTTLHFGAGGIDEIGRLCRPFGSRAVVVSGRDHAREDGTLDRLERLLEASDIRVLLFYNSVGPDPTTDIVDDLNEKIRAAGAEFLIAVGGGSPLDAAKAAAVLVVNDGACADYLHRRRSAARKSLPFVAVPTTAGTGTELTNKSVLTDSGTKIKRSFNADFPAVALVDPELTFGLPKDLTAMTGMDALTHAVESLSSTLSSALTSALALESVRLIGAHLRSAFENGTDRAARTQMAWASTIAGAAFSNTGLGLSHVFAHPLGALFGIPHGLANAILLPKVMEYNLPAVGAVYQGVAAAFGLTPEPEAAIRFVSDLAADLGLSRKLSEFGVHEKDLPQIAAGIEYSGSVATNPRTIDHAGAVGFLRSLL